MVRMRADTRTDPDPQWRWYRAGLELTALTLATMAAVFIERFTLPGVLLIALATASLILLLRLLPDSDSTAWPRLPAPERGGRRAEIYRLSWQLMREHDAASAAARRLRDTLALLRSFAPPEDHEDLDALTAQLAGRPDRPAVERVLEGVESYLAAESQTADFQTADSQNRSRSIA